MKVMKYFFESCFNESEGYEDLDRIIQRFKNYEEEALQLEFIQELHQIIDTKNYIFASKLLEKYGSLVLSAEKTEKFLKFLYDRIVGTPTNVKAMDFAKKYKVIFCPVCCPNPEEIGKPLLIEKGTIISNNQIIYICRPCKLVWLTDQIKTTDPQPYKKYMKRLGRNGTWKELKDVDYL